MTTTKTKKSASARTGQAAGYKAFESDGLNGPGKAWGVQDKLGGILYEAMFTKAAAKRLAELCDSMPDADWERHSAVLKKEGFDLSDPAVAKKPATAVKAPRKAAPKRQMVAHQPGSDYYGDRRHPGHTLWPQGIIISGLTNREAREIEKAPDMAKLLADTLRAWKDEEDSVQQEHRALIERTEELVAGLGR